MFFQNKEIRDGMRDCLLIAPAVIPFGGVFGAFARDHGLSFFEMMLASLTIYAGASQYAMVDLMGQKVPAWMIVFTVFAINFRHVLYSAALGRKLTAFSWFQKTVAFFVLVDPQFASAQARARQRPLLPTYYFAYAGVLFCVWVTSNTLGGLFSAFLGDLSRFGFDFILPIYFIGLIFGFRAQTIFWPVFGVSAVASLLVYMLIGSPWHITGGGLAGLCLAAVLVPAPDAPTTAPQAQHDGAQNNPQKGGGADG